MSKLLQFRLYVTVASGTDLYLKFLLLLTCVYILLPELHVCIFLCTCTYMYLYLLFLICTYSTMYLLSSLIVAFMFCVRANTGSPQVYYCRYHQVLIIQFGSEL